MRHDVKPQEIVLGVGHIRAAGCDPSLGQRADKKCPERHSQCQAEAHPRRVNDSFGVHRTTPLSPKGGLLLHRHVALQIFEGRLFQPGDLCLGDPDLLCDLHLRPPIKKAHRQD